VGVINCDETHHPLPSSLEEQPLALKENMQVEKAMLLNPVTSRPKIMSTESLFSVKKHKKVDLECFKSMSLSRRRVPVTNFESDQTLGQHDEVRDTGSPMKTCDRATMEDERRKRSGHFLSRGEHEKIVTKIKLTHQIDLECLRCSQRKLMKELDESKNEV